jgi:hypothetical protein
MIDAYPLAWPPGWPRTDRPTWSRFQVSQHEAQQGLLRELRLLGAKDVIISTNIPLRRDGLPYASRRAPEDQGVAVYFKLEGNDQCIPCDKWRTIAENMQAIRKTIEALRGLERWGAKEMVNAAFRGFKALPESIILNEHTARAWWEVLEVSQEASREVIKAAYKARLLKVHPDQGGSQWDFEELQKAWRESGAA